MSCRQQTAPPQPRCSKNVIVSLTIQGSEKSIFPPGQASGPPDAANAPAGYSGQHQTGTQTISSRHQVHHGLLLQMPQQIHCTIFNKDSENNATTPTGDFLIPPHNCYCIIHAPKNSVRSRHCTSTEVCDSYFFFYDIPAAVKCDSVSRWACRKRIAKLAVHAGGYAHDGGEKRNVLIVSVLLPIAVNFALRSKTQRHIEVLGMR